jgi:hypothetical protein
MRRTAAALTGLALAALTWIFLWPAQFGGRAHWLVVEGADLAPYYTDGALVIAHEQAEYTDGSLVAAQGVDGPVIGLASETATDVLGAPWLYLDGAGALLMDVTNVILSWPFVCAALLVGLTSLLRRRRQAEAGIQQHKPPADVTHHVLAS